MCAMTDQWRGPVLVTGTDTEVGKTVVTAAITAAAQAAGLRVAVVKPGQTGTATGEPGDVEAVTRLAAPMTGRTLASFPDPLAPLAAARVAELPPLELYNAVDAIRDEADKHDLVLVEGAGGLLVPMGCAPPASRGRWPTWPCRWVPRRWWWPAPGSAPSTTPRSPWRRSTGGPYRPGW